MKGEAGSHTFTTFMSIESDLLRQLDLDKLVNYFGGRKTPKLDQKRSRGGSLTYCHEEKKEYHFYLLKSIIHLII